MASPPTPHVNFPDPVILDAERGQSIVLENGQVVESYVRRAPLEESEYAYKRFEKTVKLGSRGKILYGRLYQRLLGGRYRETEELVVIKQLCKHHLSRNSSRNNHPFTEIAIAQAIGQDSQHVVGMHEVLQDDNYLYLIMPYLGDDLLKVLEVAEPNDVELMRTLATNLAYLEHHHVINRDFSPENVVVHAENHEQCCPMIDLAMGLQCAKCPLGNPLLVEAQEVACGKLPYMSPEVFRREVLSFGVDVWALGCTLFFVWARKILHDRPFDRLQLLYDQPFDRSWNLLLRDGGLEDPENVRDQVDEFRAMAQDMSREQIPLDWFSAMYRLLLVERFSTEQRSLLSGMLRLDPTERLTSRDVLNHPYLQEGQL